ncbi:MAG: bifunctional DNA-formamidopyrimidine glycosylase/DNA-(apurinic or apyrimidinic site) lyase [Thiotrichales bacterium]|jgi:formamidopyrimidine-DNA glycosylase|nr:bifunctional DNA-formamidopyrimidine glycosylase/DNA-(apurinic or apyrimidinic site) lyase [Thiotrichales bacterium]MBT3613265.1 bifunctional DNA-formamidopyrimidine glycosylase/DNA-(apurinic or apyrimidinic site) lyase [Thiotrichales bacterium]MBT3751830.1 bifunctional DNA-formamidopyrimidine glycosylase/DNA-(apurinic or apyrimidinic site) lyase [Thiotrichales bacterium]MBT3838039.1 bifunctional DNA-formamidopyrimidine glycosylase/DNA-(apurinic or apyrimidinic site) lyase [Thiotrichales bact
MPELPEVETTRRGIEPFAVGERVVKLTIRQRQLRWLIPDGVEKEITDGNGFMITSVKRRAKYLLLEGEEYGTIIIHLGMTGTLRVLNIDEPVEKHDHIDIELSNNKILRYRDPRRFGAFIWTTEEIESHPLFIKMGIEPVLYGHSATEVGEHLYAKSRKRKTAIKVFIMNQHIITGVGNIYACEALFSCGINPTIGCNIVSAKSYQKLAETIQKILTKAIKSGGTTLQDFRNSDGKPGYFQQQLQVYGQTDAACTICSTSIKKITQAQRSTWYCPQCQK